MASGKAINQLSQPRINPSPMNRRKIVQEEAPMARITPISRRRSITLSESAPLKAMLPTVCDDHRHDPQQDHQEIELPDEGVAGLQRGFAAHIEHAQLGIDLDVVRFIIIAQPLRHGLFVLRRFGLVLTN